MSPTPSLGIVRPNPKVGFTGLGRWSSVACTSMTDWTHWIVTAGVAAVVGSATALAAIQLGATDSHIEKVVQPSIARSADEQSQNTADLLAGFTRALKTRLDRIDQDQFDLANREYVLGTGYDCSPGFDTVSVMTVDIYGSGDAERICVVER